MTIKHIAIDLNGNVFRLFLNCKNVHLNIYQISYCSVYYGSQLVEPTRKIVLNQRRDVL